ncbi:MAG: flagellar hook-associated protein 3 [Desulfobacteraceae bacterium]|nr:MAG: flagellar hook-associated protein 3 [Desulfobacteraceae bacterium]
MRVANKTIYDVVKLNLGIAAEEMNNANRIVSSGKRISDLSDDPVGLTQALKIKSVLSGLDQMGRNISLGKSWLVSSESALSNVQELISDAKALSVQMASSTTSAAQRASASLTVQSMLDEIVSLANTEVGGRYVFSGSKTDTAPFGSDGTAYFGNKEPFAVKIGIDTTVQVGSDGEEVFGTIFKTLRDLRDDLNSNNVDGIRESIDNLTADFNEISGKISNIGSKAGRMEIKENIFQDLKIVNTERLSAIEDADIAEAIIELKEKELAYQAALASSSKVMQLSLVDYLE